MNEKFCMSIQISLKFGPKGPSENKSTLVQVMAWHRPGAKLLLELKLTWFTDAFMKHSGRWVNDAYMHHLAQLIKSLVPDKSNYHFIFFQIFCLIDNNRIMDGNILTCACDTFLSLSH